MVCADRYGTGTSAELVFYDMMKVMLKISRRIFEWHDIKSIKLFHQWEWGLYLLLRVVPTLLVARFTNRLPRNKRLDGGLNSKQAKHIYSVRVKHVKCDWRRLILSGLDFYDWKICWKDNYTSEDGVPPSTLSSVRRIDGGFALHCCSIHSLRKLYSEDSLIGTTGMSPITLLFFQLFS